MSPTTKAMRPAVQRMREARKVTDGELFELCGSGDAAAREALVRRYLPLARSLARRYSSSTVPHEDLAQVASLALLKAIDRFDPRRGDEFAAFAVPTILGELRRHFRDAAWALHVARGAKERAHDVQEAAGHLGACTGRSPTVQQLAEYLELSIEDVLEGLQASEAFLPASLDAPLQAGEEGDDATLAGRLGSEERGYERVEDGLALTAAVARLSGSERRLLGMRFGADMTQEQIGRRLGVSQMQVSRLLRVTLERLRRRMGDAYRGEEGSGAL